MFFEAVNYTCLDKLYLSFKFCRKLIGCFLVLKTPETFAYTIRSCVFNIPMGSFSANPLPCFWIYQKVGHHIGRHSVKDNPYQAWIETYTDEAYDEVVDRMIAMTEKAAAIASDETRLKMAEVFFDSARLEWMFWDAAYRMEEWPKW